jgi:hypothetical protein
MNELALKVERIVREVLAELAAKASSPVSPIVMPAVPTVVKTVASTAPVVETKPAVVAKPVTEKKPALDELVVNAKVVTLAELPDRLEGIRRVVVARGAIVTPAVRDELIRRRVTLAFADAASSEAAVKAVRLAIVLMGTEFDPSPLVASLARDGFVAEPTKRDCIIVSTDALAEEVAKADTLGLLLTRYTAAGSCLANRHAGVRAVVASDGPTTAALTRSVGANLLIADPKAGTFFQLKQMVTEFCRSGVRECPAVFQSRLG